VSKGKELNLFVLARIGRRGMYWKKKERGNEGKRIYASKEEEGGVLLMDGSFHLRFPLVASVLNAFSERPGIVNMKF
jgi:hypothetical protein